MSSRNHRPPPRQLPDLIDCIRDYLTDASHPTQLLDASDADLAVAVARYLLELSQSKLTAHEAVIQDDLARMMQAPDDKATVTEIADQIFRSQNPKRTMDQLSHILDNQSTPSFFDPLDQLSLRCFQTFGAFLPQVAVPLIKGQLRHEAADVILPAEPEQLHAHLRKRRHEGIRMNVNLLGEALLGEEEAACRLESYQQALRDPEIEVISVKISTLYSQISPIAREHTVRVLSERLTTLYRTAHSHTYRRADGTEVPKFVYLDMEESKDMHLTLAAFKRTLDQAEMEPVTAGLALQAYMPDSFHALRDLLEWAKTRVNKRGAPITIRIVKGANMEMERVQASLKGWAQAPYKTKLATDTNFKRMLCLALSDDYRGAVKVGLASHNLFDISYGLILCARKQIGHLVQFEMLEGMANHERRALSEITDDLLMYAPATTRDGFVNAIAYLIRRLDENSAEENFLRHAFGLTYDSEAWDMLEQAFRDSLKGLDDFPPKSRRQQCRQNEAILPKARLTRDSGHAFINEPDTDFSLPHHEIWLRDCLVHWQQRLAEAPINVPLMLNGNTCTSDIIIERFDPSFPNSLVSRHNQADIGQVNAAIECAKLDAVGWRFMPVRKRAEALSLAATEVRLARQNLLGIMMAETGKTIAEADPEISEAIDFIEFYSRSAVSWSAEPDLKAEGLGVVVVIPPWNFPVAIPCGGIAAGLAAGNTVILRPSPEAVACAYMLCQCFWKAGISRRALQFIPTDEKKCGHRLITHPDVDAVILTGGTATAEAFLDACPHLHLIAETGGKNATIITAMSDHESAISHVIQSAFGHAGQKCSATSLLLLPGELYDDAAFERMLVDAAASLKPGAVWDLATRINPLIRLPGTDLTRALTTLEPGERWALKPKQDQENPQLWSLGIKWGVKRGSFTHCNEFFGPLLGVMRYDSLKEAIDMVNETGYGLTSGLESLDDREQATWKESIRAGNLYINRPTTGAIVNRQPFGGMGKSAFGSGIKAGGPGYVTQLMTFESKYSSEKVNVAILRDAELRTGWPGLQSQLQSCPNLDLNVLCRLLNSVASAWDTHYSQQHDPALILGEDNVQRYLVESPASIRAMQSDSITSILGAVLSASMIGIDLELSLPDAPLSPIFEAMTEWPGITTIHESSSELASRIMACNSHNHPSRLRFLSEKAPVDVLKACHYHHIPVIRRSITTNGKLELLWWCREQSLSHAYHRYGNLGHRADEPRHEPN